jgi:hypothetical protein
MKVSKTILQAMMVAIAVGTISSSCKKPGADEMKKNTTEKKQSQNIPESCPACGMG